jgi:hyperosmotically inducible periplasmic protein
MNKRPIGIVLAAVLAGSVALSACDEEENGAPEAQNDNALERRDDGARPGEVARPGEPVRTEAGKEPDNTAHNKGDAHPDGAKTPFDQSEAPADIKVTADIRKAILGLEGMSTNADNVKVMTSGGVVAVRGVVESQSEIDAITKIVSSTPGVVSSDIQLSVDPN